MKPLYKRKKQELLAHSMIHADETTLLVLHEHGKEPQRKSYMWLYRTSGDTEQPIVLYEYQPDRDAKNSKEFLAGFNGYHSLPEGITVVGCWAHA